MLFPKGQVVYENLNTSFTQLDALMTELKSNQFTGYVQLVGWEYEGILLLDTGNLVNAIEESKGQRRHGPSAAANVSAKGRDKDGTVSVYRLSEEMTQLLANLFNSEPIYKDLTSDLTGLDRLAAKMQGEKLTGYIEVKMPKSQNTGTIFMRDGKVLDSIFQTKNAVVSGAKVIDQLIQATTVEPSIFTVYRADLAAVYGDSINMTDSFARQGTLTLWQDVLKTIETVVDGTSKTSVFLPAFKRACINNATQYPFLDPFAAEFDYKEGVVKFDGQATVAQFNEGVSAVVAQVVNDLNAQPIKDLMNKLKPALNTITEKYQGRLGEVGLKSALPELFSK